VRSVCHPLNAKSVVQVCTTGPVAGTRVERVLDQRCAEVSTSGGARVQPGDRFETLSAQSPQ
jgi:hypothetical protein